MIIKISIILFFNLYVSPNIGRVIKPININILSRIIEYQNDDVNIPNINSNSNKYFFSYFYDEVAIIK